MVTLIELQRVALGNDLSREYVEASGASTMNPKSSAVIHGSRIRQRQWQGPSCGAEPTNYRTRTVRRHTASKLPSTGQVNENLAVAVEDKLLEQWEWEAA